RYCRVLRETPISQAAAAILPHRLMAAISAASCSRVTVGPAISDAPPASPPSPKRPLLSSSPSGTSEGLHCAALVPLTPDRACYLSSTGNHRRISRGGRPYLPGRPTAPRPSPAA